MGILSVVDRGKIKADDVNFDEWNNPETIIHVRLVTWCNRHKESKSFKKI